MTQDRLDIIVYNMTKFISEYGKKTAIAERFSDIKAEYYINKLMYLIMIKNSLRNYDLTWNILSESEIRRLIEAFDQNVREVANNSIY